MWIWRVEKAHLTVRSEENTQMEFFLQVLIEWDPSWRCPFKLETGNSSVQSRNRNRNSHFILVTTPFPSPFHGHQLQNDPILEVCPWSSHGNLFFSVSLIEKKLLTIRLLWQKCSQGSHEPVKPPYDLSQERMPSQLMSVSQKRMSLNKKSHRHRGYSTNRSKHLCRRWRFQRHQAHA